MLKSHGMLAPLRHRAFRRVWLGQVINIAGDAALLVALVLLLAEGDRPAQSLSIALAIISAGKILSVLVGSVLTDRIRRSQLIIWSDVIGGVGSVVILFSDSGNNSVLVIAGASLIGLSSGVYQPAYQALFPSLLPRDELAAGNALRTLGNRMAGIAGSAATAAVALVASVEVVIVANIATCAVSILTLAPLGDQKPIRVGEPVGRVLAEARSGLAYVWKRRWICAIMLQGTVQVAFLTAPLNILLPLALRGTDGAYGWVVVAQSLGAVVGATIAVRREYVRPGLVAIGGATLELTLMIAVAADAHPIVIGGTGFLAGLGLALFGILWTTALQKEVPDAMLGRVFSLDMLTAIGLAPVGALLAGVAVGQLGVGPIGWICAGVLGVSIILTLAVPNVTRFSDESSVGKERRPLSEAQAEQT